MVLCVQRSASAAARSAVRCMPLLDGTLGGDAHGCKPSDLEQLAADERGPDRQWRDAQGPPDGEDVVEDLVRPLRPRRGLGVEGERAESRVNRARLTTARTVLSLANRPFADSKRPIRDAVSSCLRGVWAVRSATSISRTRSSSPAPTGLGRPCPGSTRPVLASRASSRAPCYAKPSAPWQSHESTDLVHATAYTPVSDSLRASFLRRSGRPEHQQLPGAGLGVGQFSLAGGVRFGLPLPCGPARRRPRQLRSRRAQSSWPAWPRLLHAVPP